MTDEEMAELDAWADVLSLKSEDQKPLYSNDKTRELVVRRQLKASEGYSQDRAQLRILEHKKSVFEAEIDRLRRELRLASIDYERRRLGRRDAA